MVPQASNDTMGSIIMVIRRFIANAAFEVHRSYSRSYIFLVHQFKSDPKHIERAPHNIAIVPSSRASLNSVLFAFHLACIISFILYVYSVGNSFLYFIKIVCIICASFPLYISNICPIKGILSGRLSTS